MESGKKKIKSEFIRGISGVYKGISEALKRVFPQKNRILEISLVVFLLILGLALYLTLSKDKEYSYERFEYVNKELNEGINAYRLEDFDKAEMLLLNVLENAKVKKVKSKAALYLGNIYHINNNYSEALQYYQRSSSLDKKNVYAFYNSALVSVKSGNAQKAFRYSQKVLEIDKNYLPNRILLGNILYVTGKYPEALSMFNESEGFDSILSFNHAQTYLQSGKKMQAEYLLKKIVEHPDSRDTVKGIGYIVLGLLNNRENVEQSELYLRYAMDTYPSSPILKYNLSLLLMRQDNYYESANLLRSIEGELQTEYFNELFGRALIGSGYYKEALNFYTTLFNQKKDPDTAYIMGDIYIKLDEFEKAKKYYEFAIENPENGGAFVNLIRIYIKEGNFERAVQICKEAIQHDDENPLPHTCLAEVYFALGDSAAAQSSLVNATFHSGESSPALFQIANVYKENRYYNNAIQLYHRIISAESKNYQAYGAIAQTYMLMDQHERARNIIVKIRDHIEDVDLYYNLSILLARASNTEEALRIYNELISVYPYRYEACYNLALQSIENGDFKRAIEIIEDCLKRVKGIDPSKRSNLYTVLGVAQVYTGEIRKAMSAFKLAQELDRNNEIPVMNIKMIANQAELWENNL